MLIKSLIMFDIIFIVRTANGYFRHIFLGKRKGTEYI